ncbi:zinc ribbon domain-containing protein [Nocardioides sp. AE5]|uniref:zinc ribbon domain-containing protein n=1 Tax=Nocardioides sp. AE5 TaxID=2962573 RepID=UPI002881F6C8|nr:zinc ribbon domain-containing protein [Nocardioides sp. AE5]MDT0201226.1 zinc ribbon domain-containing protein [Nocardioides sp. AE5]
MSQCPQCGAQVGGDSPFCGSCGASLAPQASSEDVTQVRPAGRPENQPPAQQQWTPPPAAPPGPPPAAPPAYGAPQGAPQQGAPQGQQQWGQPQQQDQPMYGAPQGGPQGPQFTPPPHAAPQFDFSKLLVGNWGGMALVAGAALGVALLLGALAAFTTMDDFDFVQGLAMTLMLTGAAFGVNIVESHGDDASLSIGQHPFLATVLALGAAVFLFRKVTAGYPNAKDALFDAIRAALVLTGGLVVLMIALRIWSPEIDAYAETPLSMPGGGDGTWSSIPGAIFLGFFLLLTLLALAILARRDWLSAKFAVVHDWVATPLLGYVAFVALALVAGLFFIAAIMIGDDDSRGFPEFMGMLALLPALGTWMTGIGVFAGFGSGYGGDNKSKDNLDRLGDIGDENGFMWISPVIALAVIAVALYVVIWKSTDQSRVLRNVLVYVGGLLVFIPFLVRFSNAHVAYRDDDTKSTTWIGLEAVQTTAFIFLFSLVIGAILLLVTNNLDLNALSAKAKGMANSVQQQAGGQGQPQQQWGQQPPPQGGQPPQQQWGQQPPPQAPPQQQWGQQPPPQGGQPPQQQWGQQPPPQSGQPPQQWGQQPPPQGGQPPQQQWGQQPPPQQ